MTTTGNPCTDGRDVRIVDARVEAREIPLRRPLRGARGPVSSRRERVLVLTADDGVHGAGDASRVDWLAADAPDDRPTLELLLERIRNDAPPAAALLQWSLDSAQPAALRCGLQTALLDADARRRGLPLAALLAGRETAGLVRVSALLVEAAPDAMANEAAALRALGVESFKVKVGRASLDDDVAAVAAVRAAIGAHAELRLDANGAWDFDAARTALRELRAFAPDFVEEPLRDAGRIGELSSPVAVALDESLRDAAGLERAMVAGGFEVLVLKLERVGGPLPALAMAARASRAGLDVVFTDSIDGATGRAATLHAAAAAGARAADAAEKRSADAAGSRSAEAAEKRSAHAAGPRTAGAPRAVGLGGFFLLDDHAGPCANAALPGPGLGLADRGSRRSSAVPT